MRYRVTRTWENDPAAVMPPSHVWRGNDAVQTWLTPDPFEWRGIEFTITASDPAVPPMAVERSPHVWAPPKSWAKPVRQWDPDDIRRTALVNVVLRDPEE